MRRCLAIGAAAVAGTALQCGAFDASNASTPADAAAPDAVVDDSAAGFDAALPDDPYAVADQYRDGSRLKASYYVTTEGARQFRGWFDSQLAALCDFVRHEDGKLRCVPRGANDTPLYSAPGCDESTRVVYRAECEEVPRFARRQVVIGECEPTYSVHRVGDAIAATAYYARSSESAPCPASGTPLIGGAELYERQAELPGAELVEGTEVDWTPPQSLGATTAAARFVEGSDGSRGFFRLRESYKGETCELRAASTIDPTVRCIPARTLLVRDYADPVCTKPAFGSQSGLACAKPAFGKVFTPSADACLVTEDFFLIASSTLASAYRKTGTDCSPLALDGGSASGTAYYEGTPYGLANFAAATPVGPRGTLRVDRVQLALPDGTRVPRGFYDFGRFRDQKRNEDCELRVAADGKVRCLPVVQATIGQSARYFSDDQCTLSLQLADATSCEKPPRLVASYSFAAGNASACSGPLRMHIHPIGAEVTTTVFRRTRESSPCSLVQPDPNRPIYAAGPEIAPTEFIEAIATTD